jgi:hypothetical protein
MQKNMALRVGWELWRRNAVCGESWRLDEGGNSSKACRAEEILWYHLTSKLEMGQERLRPSMGMEANLGDEGPA